VAARKLPKPTDAELEILRALWRKGDSTVREVLEAIGRRPNPGYTTVLKLLQIMTDKGLVVRDESQRAHVYRARLSEQETQGQLIDHLLDRAFGGSAVELVMQTLSRGRASEGELAEIRRLLAEEGAERPTGGKP
jgi:predicted transcriptional regulator